MKTPYLDQEIEWLEKFKNGANWNAIQQKQLAEYKSIKQSLSQPTVISRFYAVFSDYGQDLSQRSIWFDNIDKAVSFKKEMENKKGKFIILEKSGLNGL